MVFVQVHADSRVGSDVSSRIADNYVQALQQRESSVVATVELTEKRRRHVQVIVHDVISALDGVSTAPGSQMNPPVGGLAFANAKVPFHDCANVITMLFDLAYAELCAEGSWPSERVAHELVHRILSDIGHILVSMHEALAHKQEMINFERLAEHLSQREIEVFDLIVANAPTQVIAAKLFISEHTVKHHITNIGRKLKATGRQGLLTRARELGVLVAAPVVASGAMAAINSLI